MDKIKIKTDFNEADWTNPLQHPWDETDMEAEECPFLQIGDEICLYCVDTEGFVYSDQSSSYNSGLSIFNKQDRERPQNISNPYACIFKVCIQNRFKLNKKYRKLKKQLSNTAHEFDRTLAIAEEAGKAEEQDNSTEYNRNVGKILRYGQIVQLKHVFSGKYVHVSSTQGSHRDKNNMRVILSNFNAKHAQFCIHPRFKVKVQGDNVQYLDRVIFESVKSPGQFLHASAPYEMYPNILRSELNLGIEKTGYILSKSYSPIKEELDSAIKGGTVLRLFHKELEAYLTTVGLFEDNVPLLSSDIASVVQQAKLAGDGYGVYLRLRPIEQLMNPKSVYPSTNANTYWQVELESSILNGRPVFWNKHIRLRHFTTRKYLCVDNEYNLKLSKEQDDPTTVFRFTRVKTEKDFINAGTYARIQHVLTGHWLHALVNENHTTTPNDVDRRTKKKVCMSEKQHFDDVFSLQVAKYNEWLDGNLIAGHVTFIREIGNMFDQQKQMSVADSFKVSQAFNELKDFLVPDGVPSKPRQKLLRNFKVIDLLVDVMKHSFKKDRTLTAMIEIYTSIYQVFHAYLAGKSAKNAMYMAPFIPNFFKRLTMPSTGNTKSKWAKVRQLLLPSYIPEGVMNHVAQTIMELLNGHMKTVESLGHSDISLIISLGKQIRNPAFLDMLSVLCVCDGMAVPDNQNFIAKNFLAKENRKMIIVKTGAELGGEHAERKAYISVDYGTTWILIDEFCNPKSESFNENDFTYFKRQLEMLEKLCYGCNQYTIDLITNKLKLMTWDRTWGGMAHSKPSDDVRAHFCALVIALFVNIGLSTPETDFMSLAFIYDDLNTAGVTRGYVENAHKDLAYNFPEVKAFIYQYTKANSRLIATKESHNTMVGMVMKLVMYLIEFGYYVAEQDVKNLINPILAILDGRHDLPFATKDEGEDPLYMEKIETYQREQRFLKAARNDAIVDSKLKCLDVIKLLMKFQYQSLLLGFLGIFKEVEERSHMERECCGLRDPKSALSDLLYDFSQIGPGIIRNAKRKLEKLFHTTKYFEQRNLTTILLDCAQYEYDNMVITSVQLLNTYYSVKSELFRRAQFSQVMLTGESLHVNLTSSNLIPMLKHLARSRWTIEQSQSVTNAMDTLKDFCHLTGQPHMRHPTNQKILINHDLVGTIFDILSQQENNNSLAEDQNRLQAIKRTFNCLEYLAKGNLYVQERVYERLNKLLKIHGVEDEMGLCLTQVFQGNEQLCLKIPPQTIDKIVQRAADMREKAPSLLMLLQSLVKLEDVELALKRNQTYVMKFTMHYFHKVAYVLEQSRDIKEKILTGKYGEDHLRYYINLVRLISMCAEGENRFIESLAQKFINIKSIMWVLNNTNIANNLKVSFLIYLIWAFMNTAGSSVETGAADMSHDNDLWQYMNSLVEEFTTATDFIISNKDRIPKMLNSPPDIAEILIKDEENDMRAGLYYIMNGALPFIELFFRKFYDKQPVAFPEEIKTSEKLAEALMRFNEAVGFLVTEPVHLKMMCSASLAIVPQTEIAQWILEEFLHKYTGDETRLMHNENDAIFEDYTNYYSQEEELNNRLSQYSYRFKQFLEGENTVRSQLVFSDVPYDASNRAYTEIGGADELPLGKEFQELILCFKDSSLHSNNYPRAKILLKQLQISEKLSSKLKSDKKRCEQEELDIKCFKLLRAMIMNIERLLPLDYDESNSRHIKYLMKLEKAQDQFNEMGAIDTLLPHVSRMNDSIVQESLGFLSAMLMNANGLTQKSVYDNFISTAQETFFYAIHRQIGMSSVQMQETRGLVSQRRSKRAEEIRQTKALEDTLPIGREALIQIQRLERHRRQIRSTRNNDSIKLSTVEHSNNNRSQDRSQKLEGRTNPAFERKEGGVELQTVKNNGLGEAHEAEESALTELYKGCDSNIASVLQVLARLCDGQNHDMQNYLREQPDNVSTLNIIGEIVQFVSEVYSNINPVTIDLTNRILDTINESVIGNEENSIVGCDNKIIDYVNFILRSKQFASCTLEQSLELLETLGNLVYSLIEENNPRTMSITKECAESLDKSAIVHILTECYILTNHTHVMKQAGCCGRNGFIKLVSVDDDDADPYITKNLFLARNIDQDTLSADMRQNIKDCGSKYYLLMQRIFDINPDIMKKLTASMHEMEKEAMTSFTQNIISIEIIKDDNLQKVNFFVEDINILRGDVIEKVKWEVDRSSNTTKIRDLMDWSNDIQSDMRIQRKLLKNWLATFLMKNWLVWNNVAVIGSILIQVLMLVTWGAKDTINTVVDKDANPLNASIYDFYPRLYYLTSGQYAILSYTLGSLVTFFVFIVFVTYFLLNQPKFPRFVWLRKRLARKKKLSPEDEEEDEEMFEGGSDASEAGVRLETKLLSFSTFYFAMLLAAALAGTLYIEYFFAIILLNIVSGNQLLARVIKAVTLNGMSLLWVGFLGIIIMYIFTLIAFAFMRSAFDNTENFFCESLFQCFVSVTRYGLVGDLLENLPIPDQEKYFARFGFYVAFNLSFFILITTIGLNIIFGIIVDTFSELRDTKWTTEQDMKESCYICGRPSYDFELRGKGFENHVKKEHNMWAYIFFFLHLNESKSNDYTSIEKYISNMVKSKNYDFFPVNRALCLVESEEDEKETKFNKLLDCVSSIFAQQQEDARHKRLSEEKLRQEHWERENRQRIYGDRTERADDL